MNSFTNTGLSTKRLRLRPLSEADAPTLFAIHSAPEIMRYWSKPVWNSVELARARIAEQQEAMASGRSLSLGLERKSDGQVIGACALYDFSEQCLRAQIGYALASSAWGRGYMHEAQVALLDYGFSELSLNRLEADIDPRNEASARSLLRLGFQKEGHLRERWIVNGEVSDSDLYGLLLVGWQASARNPLFPESRASSLLPETTLSAG